MPYSPSETERDRASVRLYAHHIEPLNMDFREWAIAEINEQLTLAGQIEFFRSAAKFLEDANISRVWLGDLRDNEIDNIYNRLEDRINHVLIDDDWGEDPVDGRDYLDEALCRWHILQGKLLRSRRQLAEIWAAHGDPDDPDEPSDGDDV